MKILIAADSFKDALDSFGVCDAIAKGIHLADAAIETITFPLADGGEGTSDILMFHLGGHRKEVTVSDPLLRPIQTDYVISEDGGTAFIALAKSSGLQLLADHERDPMCTSTFGLGELILDAIDEGVSNVVLSIGGSATNDGGMGMAMALGFHFYDVDGQLLDGIGKDLGKVARMEVDDEVKDSLAKIKFTTICDVTNPLFGSSGAAHVFAAQKGAIPSDIIVLDNGLAHFAEVMDAVHLAEVAGAGAAGGVGFGSIFFLKSSLQKGVQWVMEMTDFEHQVRGCDLVITGEGRLDGQTAFGKLVQGVTSMASKYHKPVIALCGVLDATTEDIKNLGLQAAFSISNGHQSLADALKDTAINLELSAFNLMRCLER
jgi:glycerate 2-kinase